MNEEAAPINKERKKRAASYIDRQYPPPLPPSPSSFPSFSPSRLPPPAAAMGADQGEELCPPWLLTLLATHFFQQCRQHVESSKSECNMYCLDCPAAGALCSVCVASHHRGHCAIQIRRSSYHDVIRVSDIQKLIDISGVQTYIINSARVVFINERPQPRHGKGVTNTCAACRRSLLDSFRFCSLACKLAGTSSVSLNGEKGVIKLKKKKASVHSDSEEAISDVSTSNGSEHSTLSQSTATPSTASRRISGKRRKGIPHRSPFGSLIVEV